MSHKKLRLINTSSGGTINLLDDCCSEDHDCFSLSSDSSKCSNVIEMADAPDK